LTAQSPVYPLLDLICTRQGSNLQPYDPKSYTSSIFKSPVTQSAVRSLRRLHEGCATLSLARSIGFAQKERKRHLAALKRLVDEEQWPLAQEQARALMRHFSDFLPIDRLESADFSLSHGAVQLAAEQALSDIGT